MARIKSVFGEQGFWRCPELKRDSITAVRGPKSLADELLVVAWMFPDLIRAIDYDKIPGFFAGGYELNVPERGGEPWQYVPRVYFNHGYR